MEKYASTKFVVLAIIFAITAVITFVSMDFQTETAATTTMKQATLPVVYMQTENGTSFNRLFGYTTGDAKNINAKECLTPLPADKNLQVRIDTYGSTIIAVSYRVRAIDDLSLIEYTKVEDYEQEDDQIHASFPIKNLIDDNRNYLLEIELSTKDKDKITYYTQIIGGVFSGFQEKIDFVKEFNSNIYDSNNIKNIMKYIETNASGNNDNYGHVTINSLQSTIGWGDLLPFVESEIVPTVMSITGETAEITMDYFVGAENENGGYDSYDVSEKYRVRYARGNMYLLDYDRTANQIFDGKNDMYSTSKINMGVRSSTSVYAKSNEEGTYTLFADHGNLWELSNEDGAFTRIFSFETEDTDNLRERANKHDIRIMNMEPDGSCKFIVYGYMPCGEHEGTQGISLFSYNYVENIVKEEIFIPMDISYEEMQEKVGEIAYVDGNQQFYIMIDGTLYAINLVSREVMIEASGLTKERYAVVADGNCIAYLTQKDEKEIIRIYNMEKGENYEIEPKDDEKLKVLGFINTDFIYGVAKEDDIVYGMDGPDVFPMEYIYILDKDYHVIKEYHEDDIYITNAEINRQRMNLYRVQKIDGMYEQVAMDQLINREENSKNGVTTDTVKSDDKKTEVILVLQKAVPGIDNVTVRLAEKVIFKEDTPFSFEEQSVQSKK